MNDFVSLLLVCTNFLFVSNSVIKQEEISDIKKSISDLTYESIPADAFLTLLGPELSGQLYHSKNHYDGDILAAVIDKLMVEVDINSDGMIDAKELGNWFRKNTVINQAAEIKYMFQRTDDNMDSMITFEEYVLHSPTVSVPVRTSFRSNYLKDDSNMMDREKLLADMNAASVDGADLMSSIKYSYDLFQLADVNKDGKLDWKEYVKFSLPEYHPETQPLARTSSSKIRRKHDKDGDNKYTLDEFEVYFSHHIKHPELLPQSVKEPRAMFLYCDKNKNGFLEYAESDECVKPLLDHQINTEWLLEDADMDGDKLITREEILSAFHTLESNDHFFDVPHDEL